MTDWLANPIWHSLSTLHAELAEGNQLAKRYPRDIGPLSAIPAQSPESWEALRGLLSPGNRCTGDPSPNDRSLGDQCGLFLTEPAKLVPGLTLTVQFQLEQMLCETATATASADGFDIQDLGQDHVPEMLELTALTEPGPFRNRTIELGGYRGIREGGRLVAMAGRRAAVPGYPGSERRLHPSGLSGKRICRGSGQLGWRGHRRDGRASLPACSARQCRGHPDIPAPGLRGHSHVLLRGGGTSGGLVPRLAEQRDGGNDLKRARPPGVA